MILTIQKARGNRATWVQNPSECGATAASVTAAWAMRGLLVGPSETGRSVGHLNRGWKHPRQFFYFSLSSGVLGFCPMNRATRQVAVHDEPIHPHVAQKPAGAAEFTPSAIAVGLLVAAVIGASYPYVVLKLGFGPNISVVSAFFGYIL